MTSEQIIAWAREAGLEKVVAWNKDFTQTVKVAPYVELERFAALVAEHEREHGIKLLTDLLIDAAVKAEREACAKVCEREWEQYGYGAGARDCAEEIRARGQE
jgi:hypothetical protein